MMSRLSINSTMNRGRSASRRCWPMSHAVPFAGRHCKHASVGAVLTSTVFAGRLASTSLHELGQRSLLGAARGQRLDHAGLVLGRAVLAQFELPLNALNRYLKTDDRSQ